MSALKYYGQLENRVEQGKIVKTINKASQADVDFGNTSSFGSGFIVDSTKNWAVNSLVDNVIKLETTDSWMFCVILSNTSNTITLDDCPTDALKTNGYYRVMDTLVLSDSEPDVIIAMDIRSNCSAILLPRPTIANERMYIHAYIELANNGDHILPIVCRGADRVRGVKYLTLEHKYEGVKMYSHLWGIGHWDLLQVYSVKRYLAGYRSVNGTITSTSYQTLVADGSGIVTHAKRFRPIVKSGFIWLQYTSIVENTFITNIDYLLQKGGAGDSIVNLSIRVYHADTQITEDLTQYVTTVKLGNNETNSVSLSVPITLKHNDEITLIGKRDLNTITLLSGSGLNIHEI